MIISKVNFSNLYILLAMILADALNQPRKDLKSGVHGPMNPERKCYPNLHLH